METYFPTAPRGNYNVLLSNDSHDCLILDFLHDANFCEQPVFTIIISKAYECQKQCYSVDIICVYTKSCVH